MKYRPQWPILIEDCYECGRGIHFQKPWRRVYPPISLSVALRVMIENSRSIMTQKQPAYFSKDALVNIQKITVPRVVNDSEPFGPKADDVTQQFEWTYDATDTV